MPDQTDFVLRFLLFAGAHSLFAASRVKALFSRSGKGEPRLYRLAYNIASLAAFGWVMAAFRNAPVLYELNRVVRWMMHSGQLATAATLLFCVSQTGGGDFLGIDQLRPSAPRVPHLVTTGCYARVRHPLYLLSMLFLLLSPVMTVSWALLTIMSFVYFIAGGMIEERRLLEQFGDEYRSYRKRVPFMIPANFMAAGPSRRSAEE